MSLKSVQRFLARLTRTVMKSHRLQVPKYDLPIRFRPWFLIFTCIVVVVLAFLGFTNFTTPLPINDKMLHFACFSVATCIFYFIVDVDESARRIWFWRYSALIFTMFCTFCGGVLIEVVQATLPFKEFEWADVAANLLGSSVGLWAGFNLDQYYRHRREISRLYQPLSTTVSEFEEGDDDDTGMQLLPTYSNHKSKANSRLTDVWDEQEEPFGVGDESEGEGGQPASTSQSKTQPPRVVSHS